MQAPFGERQLNDVDRTMQLLTTQLPKGVLSSRAGPGGRQLLFLDTAAAIHQANLAFGPASWSSQIVSLEVNFSRQKPGGIFSTSYSAIVRVTLENGCFHEDVGSGSSESPSESSAIQNAKKSAVSDAVKRCLRYFGDYCGRTVRSGGVGEYYMKESGSGDFGGGEFSGGGALHSAQQSLIIENPVCPEPAGKDVELNGQEAAHNPGTSNSTVHVKQKSKVAENEPANQLTASMLAIPVAAEVLAPAAVQQKKISIKEHPREELPQQEQSQVIIKKEVVETDKLSPKIVKIIRRSENMPSSADPRTKILIKRKSQTAGSTPNE